MDSSTRFPIEITLAVVVGASLWCLSVVFFLVQFFAAAASTRPYSLSTNVISDLGATQCGVDVCSPLHVLVNITFVVTGLCQVAGATLTRSAFPRSNLTRVAMVLLELAGAGLITVGANPENLSRAIHDVAALLGLICLNVAMILYGVILRPSRRWLGGTAVAAGVVGLVGLVVFLVGSPLPGGTAERIADYPATLMVIVLGGVILTTAAVADRTGTTTRRA